MESYHIPVLYKEVLDNLVINPDGVYVDGTLGGGGHSQGILEKLSDKGRLISIDQDAAAIEFAKKRLEPYGNKVKIFRDNFQNMDTAIYMAGYEKVDGILLDIGVSSKQLDDEDRGFSYRADVRLDMRMDNRNPLSAFEVVNEYSEEKLMKIMFEYGEERFARKIARFIVENREKKTIETTGELVDIIRRCVGSSDKHPAKRTFQAIRIEVNNELGVLENTIKKSIGLLKSGGRIAIISFHSLEDRIIKNMFNEYEKGCICPPKFPKCVCGIKPQLKVINRKPIIPGDIEVKDNKRSHSSKLRVAEKL